MNQTEEEKKEKLEEEPQAPVEETPAPEPKPVEEQEPESPEETQPPVEEAEPSAPAAPETTPEPQPEQPAEPQPAERMFTQEEMNALAGRIRQEARQKAREEYASEIRSKYGLDDDSQLDDLIGNGQRFDALNGEYETQSATLNDLKAENALLKSGIPEDRFNDVKAVLAYSQLDVTPENIAQALTTHPEWKGTASALPVQPPAGAKVEPTKVVPKLGGEPSPKENGSEDAERAEAMKMFGF